MKDLDFITSKLKEENITAPDALSEENIEARLAQGTSVSSIVKTKKNKKRILKPLVSVAACIALVIGSFALVNALRDARFTRAIEGNTKNGVVYFESYDEIKSFVGKITPRGGVMENAPFMPRTLFESNTATKSSADAPADGAASHSTTYTQVADVDEADIVKTDGEYIYFVDGSEESLIIYSAQNGKTEFVSQTFFDDEDYTAQEMFLDGDSLYLVGTGFKDDESNTVVIKLDIRNREKAKTVYRYAQSGTYSTSRMANGCIYVISNTYTYGKNFIPCYTGVDGEYKKIPAGDICAFDCCREPNYAIVGALDTRTGESKNRKVKAVMGGADNVYCTTENLYFSCANYDEENTTTIIKYALNGVKVREWAVSKVRGYVNNQWSFDERNGYLRVATTAYNNSGTEINKLYILDKNLKKVSDVGGFAKNEHIEAVKYIGDMAYVITYETTDPLFCIDLSNPKAPEITGKVKIDGFSTNLVPIGEDKLMGIGYYTRTNQEWGGVERAGVKLALFDISNKNAPRVLDEKVYKDAYSPAQETHKAILVNGDTLAIPVNYYAGEDTDDAGNAVVFTEKNGKIAIMKEATFATELDRIVSIGEDYYAVDTTGESVTAFTVR